MQKTQRLADELQDSKAARIRFALTKTLAVLAVALAAVPGAARAQADYPNKPIRLVINFAAGSSPDIVGRTIATPLAQALGQPIVIENRTGAGGTVGVDAVAKAAPDGYTLMVTAGSTMTIVPHVMGKLPYNPEKDVIPVAAGARIENFLVVRADLPTKTYKEFVEYAKRNPGKLTYGSAGSGTSPHIAAEIWKAATGVFALHIPYRGTAPAIQDMLGGQIDFMMDSGSSFPHVKSGKFRVLGVATSKRLPMLPDVPTFEELGLKLETGTTHAFYAPAGTPAPIVDKLNREINRVLAQPGVAQTIQNLGAAVTPISPAELRAVMEADSKRYAAIVRKAGIKPD
jgi:tripartite-type tricarboxylate transporter receptor subunit TctC